MKVAALQMVSTPRRDDNLAAARALLEQAAQEGVELAVLPEYFCAMGARDTDKLALRELPGEGVVQSFLAQAARDLDLWIVGGTLPLACQDPGRVRNTSLAYAPGGTCVARYDKIHLFRFDNGHERFDEGATIEPGSAPVQFLLPSRSGRTWRRARAVENQAYVLAPAQGGRHETGRRTWGHSMLVDPWGEVLAVRPEGAGVVAGLLDRERLRQVRLQLPALEHRVL